MNIYSFDLDGTLLPRHFGTIRPEIYDKINSFVDAGHVVIFNSGRPFGILRKYIDPIHLSDRVYLSINNGSALLKQDGTVIYVRGVPNDRFVQLKKEHPDLSIFTYTLKDVLVTFDENDIVAYEAKVNEMPIRKVSADSDFSSDVMLKFLICGPKEKLDGAVIDYDREKYSLIRTKDIMYEMMAKNADKVTAIDYVKSLYGNIDDVYVFGDADNDAEAVRKYHGITFSNGTEKCKKHAEYVSPFSSDDGVLDAFKVLKL